MIGLTLEIVLEEELMKSKTQQNAVKTSNESGEIQARHEAYEGPIPHPNILTPIAGIIASFMFKNKTENK